MQQSSSTIANPLVNELFFRAKLGLFMFLAWKLAAVTLQSVTAGDVELILLCLVEVSTMVLLSMLFSNKNVAKDLNELNCYALLAHLLYLPAYYQLVSAEYHNIAIKILLSLAAIRLIYFGPIDENNDYKGVSPFGILEHTKTWIHQHNGSAIERISNYLPTVLFFGSVIPLAFIMWRAHDLVITGTIIGLMIFIFLIAQQLQKKSTSVEYGKEGDYLVWSLPADASHKSRERMAAIKSVVENYILAIDDPRVSNAEMRNELIKKIYDDEAKYHLLNEDTIALSAIFNARSAAAKQIILNIVAADFNLHDQDGFLQHKKSIKKSQQLSNAILDKTPLSERSFLVGYQYESANPITKNVIDELLAPRQADCENEITRDYAVLAKGLST